MNTNVRTRSNQRTGEQLAFVVNLPYCRCLAGLPQWRLAWLAGVYPSTISRLERGACPARTSTVAKIAAELGVTRDALSQRPLSDDVRATIRASISAQRAVIERAVAIAR